MLTRRGRLRAAGIVVAGLTLLGLAACGASSHSSSSTGFARGAAPAKAPDGVAGAPDNGGVAGGSGAKAAPTGGATLPAGDVQRSIIYRGSMTVRVSDVNVAATRATALATGDGGYVGADQRTVDSQASVATLTLRVPAARFASALSALSALGREQTRQVSTQDVTEQVVDIQSRIKTQQASVARIRALLAQATSISQIESIEGELTSREADLESMEAQMRSLSDLTSLSTITVTLLGPEAETTPKPVKHGGFMDGLTSGWHTFLDSIRVLLTIIGALLPFAIVIGVPLWIVWWVIRRHRRRAMTPAVATANGVTPPEPENPASA